jgi:hypothetical protein
MLARTIGSGKCKMLPEALPVDLAADATSERWQVVLSVGVLDVGQKLSLLADEVHPAAKQVPRRPLLLRIHVRHGQHLSTKQRGDFLAVDLVVLFHLRAVDRFHVQRVAEHEGDVELLAQIGDPVPAEHALDRDDQVLSVGGNGCFKGAGVGGQILVHENRTVVILDAEVHRPCVQVDAAVVLVVLFVKAHMVPPQGWIGIPVVYRGSRGGP